MSLPPILEAGFIAVPNKGTAPAEIVFTDASIAYEAIEQTGDAPNTITQSGNRVDYIRQE